VNSSKIIFTGALGGAWLVALGAFLMGLALWSYLSSSTRPTPGRLFALLLCRLAAIACALFALAGPAAKSTELVSERLRLDVLIDNSRSMSIADTPQNLPRIEVCRKLFEDAADGFEHLARKFDVAYYVFGESMLGVEAARFAADRARTAVADAVIAALSRRRASKVGAILIASDGVSNAGASYEEAVQAARSAGVGVFSLVLGGRGRALKTAEAAVISLRAPKRAVADDEVAVSAEVRLVGALGSRMTVRLKVNDKTVQTRRLDVESDSVVMTVPLSFVPAQEGLARIAVEVAPLEGELVTANNRRSSYVNVVKGGLKVLMIEGSFRPELTFLRRSLEGAAEIVPRLLIVLPDSDDEAKVPVTKSDWRKFDVVMLGDLAARSLKSASMTSLAKAVEEGTGFAVLGGLRNFGEEGYQDTPLAPLFPTRLSERDGFRAEHYRLKPTEAGLRSSILRLRGSRIKAQTFWLKGARLADYIKTGPLKEGAVVLATGPRGAPVIVSHRYGAGRVAAVLTDTTWRWVLSPVDYSEFHKRFWRQLILYLAAREAESAKKVWMEMTAYGFSAGEKGTARLYIGGGNERPSRLAVRAEARSRSGESHGVRFLDEGEYFAADLSALPAGDYLLRAEVTSGGKPYGSAATRFVINESAKEFERIRPALENLKLIAEATGGDYRENGKLDELLDRIGELKGVYKYTRESVKPLWNTAWLFLLFVLALSLEWGLRRRWGMA